MTITQNKDASYNVHRVTYYSEEIYIDPVIIYHTLMHWSLTNDVFPEIYHPLWVK
jgi:hypothetical protein